MKAYLKNYRQSPRKVRLIADLIRGKSVADAESALTFATKRATGMFHKLLASAVANAQHNFKTSPDQLFVSEVSVNKGPTLKRIRQVSRGCRKANANIRKRRRYIWKRCANKHRYFAIRFR